MDPTSPMNQFAFLQTWYCLVRWCMHGMRGDLTWGVDGMRLDNFMKGYFQDLQCAFEMPTSFEYWELYHLAERYVNSGFQPLDLKFVYQ